MEIFPSVDIRGGKVVRLTEGDYGRMSVYGGTPYETATRFYEGGARNLHVVDLDGAKDGTPGNIDIIRSICSIKGLFVEVGGGVRDEASVDRILSFGAGRAILGTVAVRDTTFTEAMVGKYGNRIAVGVDARGGAVAVSGWLVDTGIESVPFCKTLRDLGVSTVIYTDISRDGGLRGTNLEVYRELAKLAPLNITASGGISFEHEILELRTIGIHAAILGKAIFENKIGLARAIAIADGLSI